MGMVVHFYNPIIPALGRLMQEEHKFMSNLGCTARPFFKKVAIVKCRIVSHI
jgi:hypothetical protein